MKKIKIFISGTQDDMKLERNTVDQAINSTLISTGIRAETAFSQPQSPRSWIEQQIRECNIYIGIYSHRYGWVIPDENISATEFEYDFSQKLGKQTLIWIRKQKDGEESNPNFSRQEQFLNRVSDFSTGFLREEFENLIDLEKKVISGLSELFTEMIRNNRPLVQSPKIIYPEIPPWYVSPSLINIDESNNENKKIQLDILINNLVVENINRFAFVGKSGCGKSMIMKALMHSISNHYQASFPCIYIPLGDYAHNLASTIKNKIAWQQVPDDDVLVELGRLKVILLLDGLNEVPGVQREQCRNEIKTLMNSYPGGIVVSFISVDRSYFNFECPTYEIVALDEVQIKQVVMNYFKSIGKEQKSDIFLGKFLPIGKSSLDFIELAGLPLNLQFMLELESDSQFNIYSTSDIYSQVINRRLSQLERQEKKGKFSLDIIKDCLTFLALQSLVNDAGVRISKTFAKTIFSTKLSTVESSEILIDIIRSGLLIELQDDVQWFHASLRDYLVGYHLYTLAKSNLDLDQFPIERPEWNDAVVYAVLLSTTSTDNKNLNDLLTRPIIFNNFLKRQPSTEMLRFVIREYSPSNLVGDSPDREGTVSDFMELKWGERFLNTYHQIISILEKENYKVSQQFPNVNGLKIFVSASGRFCTIVLSDEDEIQVDDISHFNDLFVQAIKDVKPCIGFCLHGYLLPTIDPEVMAFSQIAIWLNLFVNSDIEEYEKWIMDIPSYSVFTPNEWVDWQTETNINFQEQEIKRHQKVNFTWQEFYVPLSFHIDPVVTSSERTAYASRHGSLNFDIKPASHISLMLLLSGSPKNLMIDLGTKIYIPIPLMILSREYFVDSISMSYTKGGPLINFVHLRG